MAGDINTRVFIITLPSATDRIDAIREGARNSPLPWEVFEAYCHLHDDLSYDESDPVTYHGRPLKIGELGCYSSHFAVWKKIIGENVAQAIVLEDDLVIDWQALSEIAQFDLASKGINYLRLFYKHPVDFSVKHDNFILPERYLLELFGLPKGTQGYLITNSGARQFADACRVVRRTIDAEMDRAWSHGIPNLAIFPFPVSERYVQSIIGTTRYKSVKKTDAFLKLEKKERCYRKRYRRKAKLCNALRQVGLDIRFSR